MAPLCEMIERRPVAGRDTRSRDTKKLSSPLSVLYTPRQFGPMTRMPCLFRFFSDTLLHGNTLIACLGKPGTDEDDPANAFFMKCVEFLFHERGGQGDDGQVDRVRYCRDGRITAVAEQRLVLRVHGIDRSFKMGEVLEDGRAGLRGLVRGADERDGPGVEKIVKIVRHD